ncbi:alpha/beta hydrolase [Geodermatophilus maliterrae]|uniref:Alpha/beta hydrolase n=1 Tax=Geodermatophilus maliterrae TaxID=3162531 RepID=A0ABV3XLQ3_9ACTN
MPPTTRTPAAGPGTGPRPARDGRLGTRPGTDPAGPPLPPGTTTLDLAGAEALVAVPDGPPGPRPLLVFCHGAGGNAGQSLGAVGDVATSRGVVVLATTSVAATWDLLAGGLGRDVAVLDAALEQVAAGVAVSRVALGGFSDGASYALSLGLANGGLFEALLAFSPGFVAPPGRDGRPRVWISHGTHDRVLPVARCGRRVSRDLATAGYDVVYEEFDGGHLVMPDLVTAALRTWLGPPG